LLLRRLHSFPFVLVWAAILYGAETPIPETPSEWVTDTANFLSPEAVRTLNARLSEYQQATGHQLIVYIAPTTGDTPVEDWAVRAFAKWKVGRKGLDDGLALFIMPQDRKIRIEVGYGLEAVIPDAIASRVINEVMVPRIQAAQRDEAVTAAIESLTGVIDKQAGALPPETQPSESTPLSGLRSIFYGIIGVLILGLLITHPSLALYFLTSILSGGRGSVRGGGGGVGWGGDGGSGWRDGGGFGWGGGGFSGGGGRSGGGGASGSW
jgi:uncharacterized protein